jgi:hypothetical protein
MLVELGNSSPVSDASLPAVCYMTVPDVYTYVVADSAQALADETAAHLGRASGGATHLPDQEALLSVVAAWNAESLLPPLWVWSDNDDFAVLLGHFFNAPVGRPIDVEQTHSPPAGPPGVGPALGEDA